MAKILIVVKTLDDIGALKNMLEASGHDTMACPLTADIPNLVITEGMDLVFIHLTDDCHEIIDTVQALKCDEIAKDIPIVVWANSEDEADCINSALEAGADDYIAEPASKMEISTKVETMLRIRDLGKTIKQTNMIMREEVEMAHHAQFSMLPTGFPYADQISFHTEYIATGHVGGDYYDVADLGDGKVGIILADISGHGPSAALIVSILKSIWHSNKELTTSPSMLAEAINDQFLRFTPAERFASMFHGVYDVNSKILKYVKCGHPYPFILRKNGKSIEKLEASGDFVGIHTDFVVEETSVQLEQGDRLLIYSDGLIESYDKSDSLYGFDRLIQKLKESFDLAGDTLVDTIVSDSIAFCKGKKLPDDVTVMLMKVQ